MARRVSIADAEPRVREPQRWGRTLSYARFPTAQGLGALSPSVVQGSTVYG